MTAVFVHGVPETARIWDPLVESLGLDDAVTLTLPGFGTPLPDGFEPTMHAYADWLAGELADIAGPVDLVTHDWGALLAVRVLATAPGPVRSWVTDGANLDERFEWHDTAQAWQTPEVGEAFMEGVNAADLAARIGMLETSGAPRSAAEQMAETWDETMADAILVLYRSAVNVGTEWGPGIDDITVPTLVIDAPNDGFRAAGAQAALAERLGARVVRLEGQGHWWMAGDPDAGAAAIAGFWAGLG